jgi:Cohesin loading factor
LFAYHSLVRCGIKCLIAVLQIQGISLKVEMMSRLRLAEVLVSETDNIDFAEDLLSKGVLSIFEMANGRYCGFQRWFCEDKTDLDRRVS